MTARRGPTMRRLTVALAGAVVGAQMQITARFVSAAGAPTTRVWRLRRQGAPSSTGQEGALAGVERGTEDGPEFTWRSRLRVAERGRSWMMTFAAWLSMTAGRTLFPPQALPPLGLQVEQVQILFQSQHDAARHENCHRPMYLGYEAVSKDTK